MTKRDELLARIDERLRETREDVKAVLIQTTATNGRVTSLENWRAKLKGVWLAVVVAATAGGAIVTMIIELLINHQ